MLRSRSLKKIGDSSHKQGAHNFTQAGALAGHLLKPSKVIHIRRNAVQFRSALG